MIKLYVKIALRYLFKNRLYSFLNIGGLAVGVASFLIIMIYVNYEKSYDTFENSENVYRVFMDYKEGDTFEAGDAQTYNLSGPTLTEQIPEVLGHTTLYYFEKVTFDINNQLLTQLSGAMADESYLDIFKYNLIEGDRETALKEPNTLVLSETLEQKLFGTESGIGKVVSVFSSGEEISLKVTGIIEDIPSNSHFKPTFLISFATQKTWTIFSEDDYRPNWNMNNFYTYITLKENSNIDKLRNKIFAVNVGDADNEERHNIEAIENIHLESSKPYEIEANGSASRVKFLSAIAYIILILSWLNYVNLASSKSLERAREIGIRKVTGALRTQIISQSILESLVLNLVSLIIALLICLALSPLLIGFSGIDLDLALTDVNSIIFILSVVFFGMFLAAAYPAIVISGYNPVKALKGKIQVNSSRLSFRKGLIITQFVATIVLLIGTFVVTKQMNFLDKQTAGVDMNNLISLNGVLISDKPDSVLVQDYQLLQKELNEKTFVKITSSSSTYPGDAFDNLSSTRGILLPNGEENNNGIFYTFAADSNFFALTDIDFKAGHNFISSELWSNEVVVNEKWMKEYGIQSPDDILNKSLNFWGNDWIVSGIVKDHHQFGVKKPVLPIIYRKGFTSDNMLVKFEEHVTSQSEIHTALTDIESTWNRIFPESTFNYTFLDEKFEAQYTEDRLFAKAFTLFTILAIFIACLGLFGLTSYTCLQRRKEIGIRKVNGANVISILKMLNKDFVLWIGIAFVIAAPLGYYAMNKWLENFPMKTSISWWIFILSGISVILISLITASWQTVNAALSNPVNTLKNE
ncbi:MAG: ABC transporter permease [Flavobacteriales bacterium]